MCTADPGEHAAGLVHPDARLRTNGSQGLPLCRLRGVLDLIATLAAAAAIASGPSIAAAAAADDGAGGSSRSEEESRTIRGGSFTLVDHTGRIVTDRDFRGSFMLLYFGYTHCPDVCPAGLQVVAEAMKALGDDADRVQPIFVTFDPKRDTVERLAEFVSHFHPRLIGLTGTKQQALSAANAYGVNVSATYAANSPQLEYSMNHSAFTYLVGPDGRLRTMFRDGIDGKAMAAAIRKKLQEKAHGIGAMAPHDQ